MSLDKANMEGGLRTKGFRKKSTLGRPLLSIVTVVYNGKKHMEQTIQSVISQSYENTEYIIIDGGSTDGTLDIIKKYEDKIDHWVSEPDNGIYDAMNKGIEMARGDLIGIINSDDYYEPETFRAIVDKYKTDPFPQILYGNTYMLHPDLTAKYKAYSHTKYWLGMGICHSAMFVHKDIYATVGKYDLECRISSDFDFVVKALMRKVTFVPLDKFLVNYRISGFSTVNFRTTLRENREIIGKYFKRLSIAYLVYSVLYFKSMTLIALEKIIKMVLGDKVLHKARVWYLRSFYAREREQIL